MASPQFLRNFLVHLWIAWGQIKCKVEIILGGHGGSYLYY